MKYIYKYSYVLLILIISASCKKFLALEPIDSPTENNFYVDEKGLQGGLISCYDALQDNGLYGNNYLTLVEIRGDNVQDDDQGASGGVRYQIESFAERPDNTIISDTWFSSFRAIYRCNVILNRASDITMNETTKNQIIGQASFIRALMYFNSTRLWGKLPLITAPQSSDEARGNTRAEVDAIYSLIVKDLETAINSLPERWPDAQRGRATSTAATALLAKVYLYQKNFAGAATLLAPIVAKINEGGNLTLVPQPETFPNALKTSSDIIFSVQYLAGGVGESVHQNNRFRNSAGNNNITIPQAIFDISDNRRALVQPPANGERPEKFDGPQLNNETSMDMPVLRCAEVMLMYAEALNEDGYPNTAAFAALNAVRTNAGVAEVTAAEAATQAAFRRAVYNERRLELALECDRWFDIVRTGQMPEIYPLVNASRALYPVPEIEIQNVTNSSGWQNEGH